jgi:alpha-L-fucosidase
VTPTQRQLAWQTREIQALIHFGPNTFTSKEWGSGFESPSVFNPTNLDCGQWVAAAQAAGVQSITLVCKHHDGFCLWPTEFTSFSVKSSPWRAGKGDLVREMSEACRKAGLKFGIYISPADLHEPSYGRNSQQYNDFFCSQLGELLAGYGEICEVFFDGAKPSGRHQVHDFPRYYRLIRELQPNAVITVKGPDVRWVGNEQGTARESEWSVIPLPVPPVEYDWPDLMALDLGSRGKLRGAQFLHWYPAVADVSLRQGWFWQPGRERSLKSLNQLIHIYEHSVGRNAVLMLGLAPNTEGLLPESDVQRLKEFGAAIKAAFATNLLASTNAKSEVLPKPADCLFEQRITFREPQKINYLVLREDITKGQRVEAFEVTVTVATTDDREQSQRLFRATTIGNKRILKLNGALVRTLLLHITQSRATPFVQLSAY